MGSWSDAIGNAKGQYADAQRAESGGGALGWYDTVSTPYYRNGVRYVDLVRQFNPATPRAGAATVPGAGSSAAPPTAGLSQQAAQMARDEERYRQSAPPGYVFTGMQFGIYGDNNWGPTYAKTSGGGTPGPAVSAITGQPVPTFEDKMKAANSLYDVAKKGVANFAGTNLYKGTPAAWVPKAGGVPSIYAAPTQPEYAESIFAGELAAQRTGLYGLMQKAKSMFAKGVADETVRKATGVSKAMGGKLQFEISDKLMRIKNAAAKTIGEAFSHPGLFDAYPEMRGWGANIKIDKSLKEATGVFNRKTKTLSIKAPSMEEAEEKAVHELNHTVQLIEGFPVGGNPGLFRNPNVSASTDKSFGTTQRAFDEYLGLAGEIASRDAAARRKLSNFERLQTAPAFDPGALIRY